MSRQRAASFALPAHARNARDRGDAAIDAWKIAETFALELVGLAGEDRPAAERVAIEADLDRQLALLDDRLGLGLDLIDEGRALAERTVADPAGKQGRGETDQEFDAWRHGWSL